MRFDYTVCDICEYSSNGATADNMRSFFHFEISSNLKIASGMDVCDKCSPRIWDQALNIRQLFTVSEDQK